MSELPAGNGEVDFDPRMYVHNGDYDDGERVLKPWLSLKDDNPADPK